MTIPVKTICIVLLVLWTTSSNAQILSVIELPSSFNPVGSGARALGMGGAFISVADDATAASWNPGGLVQLQRPEISAVGAFVNRVEDNSMQLFPVMSGKQEINAYNINYLSATYPLVLFGRNMVFSLNYQYLYDLHRDWRFPFPVSPTQTDHIVATQDGGLGAVGLAFAVELTPDFSFGITFNSWCKVFNANKWKNRVIQHGDSGKLFGAPVSYWSDTYDDYELSGTNFSLGLLWNINSKVTMGMVLKTPFTADIRHGHAEMSEYRLQSDNSLLSGNTVPYFISHDKLEMPMSYGIGISYRFSDALTVSGDIYRTEWDDYKYTDHQGIVSSPISGRLYEESDVKPTHQLRLGMEYLFIDTGHEVIIPLRAGIFYDPAPAEGNPDDYFGISLGSGFAYKSFIFDIACQYRFGRDVGTSFLEELKLSQDVNEFTVYSSVIVHF